MKIGILTFHNSNNYGAILQALGLQTKLINLGFEPIIIDYICQNKKDFYKIIRFNKSKSILSNIKVILDSPFNLKRIYKIKKFTEKALIKTNKDFHSSKEIKDENLDYSMFICGSDQIWNYENTKFDETYLLDFVDEYNRKMSYAASFGLSKIDDIYKDSYKKHLNNIKYLSVREESGRNIIKDIANKEATVVFDPTLLLDKSEWIQLIKKYSTKNYKEKYILLYTLHNSKEIEKLAKIIAKKNSCSIIKINSRGIIDILKTWKSIIPDPMEFINLINNAHYVVTDSFHGTIFSLNFNKEFYAYLGKGINNHSRIENILKKCNLESRIIRENYSTELLQKINYDEVNSILQKEREKSIDFITKSLEECSYCN